MVSHIKSVQSSKLQLRRVCGSSSGGFSSNPNPIQNITPNLMRTSDLGCALNLPKILHFFDAVRRSKPSSLRLLIPPLPVGILNPKSYGIKLLLIRWILNQPPESLIHLFNPKVNGLEISLPCSFAPRARESQGTCTGVSVLTQTDSVTSM